MKITEKNFFTTSDGAHIYFEDRGSGPALIMVPGFLCTTKFFEKNAEALSKEFRVITMDPRGQGNSSKTLQGNTLKRHAKDIHELAEHLKLDKFVLLGWSLAASTVVTYATDFKQDKLMGLVMMDGSLFPFSGDEWNHHRARNYDVDNWMNVYLPLFYDSETYYQKFMERIGCHEEDKEWVIKECRKTMPWTGLELHYDFCLTNNVKNLPKITVPVAVFGAKSKAYGLEMVHKFASLVSGYSEVDEFYDSGHLMFMYEADKFNQRLTKFMHKAVDMDKEK
jgi:non-heme chloroperoxidase